MEYQRYNKWNDTWSDIYNCPIKDFRRKYPRVKTRVKPPDNFVRDVAMGIQMIKRFITII